MFAPDSSPPDPYFDLNFPIIGHQIPYHHAYYLYSAICQRKPQIHNLATLSIHPINGEPEFPQQNKENNDNTLKVSININKLVPDQIINQILEGGIVKKLRFIKHHAHSDLFDDLNQGIDEEREITKEIIFKSKEFPIISKLRRIINGNNTVKEVFEIEEEYDTLKLEIDIGGRKKTIEPHNLLDINPSINITNELTLKKIIILLLNH